MRDRFLLAMAAAGAGLAVLAMPAPAFSQDCAAEFASLPDSLAGWTDRQPITAAKDTDGLAGARLVPGQAVDAALASTAEIEYPVRPEKPGGSVSYGGLFAFTVGRPGTYRVGIGSGTWLDVVRDGELVQSGAHGPGPECTGLRKMVDFPLEPGEYTLLIAANGSAELPLIVARLP